MGAISSCTKLSRNTRMKLRKESLSIDFSVKQNKIGWVFWSKSFMCLTKCANHDALSFFEVETTKKTPRLRLAVIIRMTVIIRVATVGVVVAAAVGIGKDKSNHHLLYTPNTKRIALFGNQQR